MVDNEQDTAEAAAPEEPEVYAVPCAGGCGKVYPLPHDVPAYICYRCKVRWGTAWG